MFYYISYLIYIYTFSGFGQFAVPLASLFWVPPRHPRVPKKKGRPRGTANLQNPENLGQHSPCQESWHQSIWIRERKEILAFNF